MSLGIPYGSSVLELAEEAIAASVRSEKLPLRFGPASGKESNAPLKFSSPAHSTRSSTYSSMTSGYES